MTILKTPKYITLSVFLISAISSCSQSDNDKMYITAYDFLQVVKSKDTDKIKSNLYYGEGKTNDELFNYKVNFIATLITKYGIPAQDKTHFGHDIQNTPQTYRLIFPMKVDNASEYEEANIEVDLQKISGQFKVVLFHYNILKTKLDLN